MVPLVAVGVACSVLGSPPLSDGLEENRLRLVDAGADLLWLTMLPVVVAALVLLLHRSGKNGPFGKAALRHDDSE